ncbi:GTP cyclohydrolase 1 type 2/Nif3 [Chytridium lagenaria]|nr:GTP cyclohydrolase 1 type 2/Nif3 [Chytridium lagenaria]
MHRRTWTIPLHRFTYPIRRHHRVSIQALPILQIHRSLTSLRSSTIMSKEDLSKTFSPMALAEPWDNVGILMDPPLKRPNATKILLCNDLTESVVKEVYEKKDIGVILAYHPPIFSGLKRLTVQDERQYVASACIGMGVSVVSPHTALDNCVGGVNDWLAMAFKGLNVERCVAGTVYKTPVAVAATSAAKAGGFNEGLAEWSCVDVGGGEPTIAMAVEGIKKHLGLERLRVAFPPGMTMESKIRNVGICAGSGSSVLKDVKADLLFTGEMSHHDVLATMYRRSTVVLCEHSNTERGYLKVLAGRLEKELEKLGGEAAKMKCAVSEADKEALVIV